MSRTGPMWFGPEARPLFGWLHGAERQTGDLGVVVCAPFGREGTVTHRSVRHFAAAAAAAGVPALRFDYDGTGDSAGDDRDAERLGAWVASVHTAVEALRRGAGVRRVALLGVRLGALLAALAALERDDVVALVAIAPVVSGRAYLRELRALQLAMGLEPPPGGAPVDTAGLETSGFLFTEETHAALGKVDLLRLDRAPAPEVLILDRDDLPGADRWAERLRAAGAKVDARRVAGYVEMMLDTHNAVVPEQMVGQAASWLRERAGDAVAPPTDEIGRPRARVTSEVEERAVFVDEGARLFGITSEPATAPRSGRAILLLNAGAINRVGPNRLYVRFARSWAAMGHLVLRLDCAGLGDSPPRPGEPENIVYAPRALEDVQRAVAFLRRQAGVSQCQAIGLCSGAYHAFKAAVAGQPLDGAVMINPLTFFYDSEDPLDAPRYATIQGAQMYTRSAFSLAKWRKLLRGEVDLQELAGVISRRAAILLTDRARDLSRRLGFPWLRDLGAELEAVARHGTRMQFIFSRGEAGPEMLRDQGGSVVDSLRRRGALHVAMISGPDHTFTALWTHDKLAAALLDALEARAHGARRHGAA